MKAKIADRIVPVPFGHAPDAAAGVVHSLGNLIQIASSAITIVNRNPDMPETHFPPLLHRASSCLDHAGALVRRSICQLRTSSFADTPCNVASCLAEVATLIGSASEPGIAVELDVEIDLPRLQCDALALHNAVLNLVLNARAAMVDGGVIAIRGRRISRSEFVPWIEISVADAGIGMSPATIACAFDPFFTTKSEGLGGFGLPMVERFVTDAGGEISLESAPGAGTTVHLRLPAIDRSMFEESLS
jgi:signal transduction histidine kinase